MTGLLSDLRFALRVLGKSSGFVAVAVMTLALAIGVNSAVFSLINGLILRPVIPYKPSEVVSVFTTPGASARSHHLSWHTRDDDVRVGCVLLLVVIADLLDAATARPRVAFLDKGEVWTLQSGSRGPQRQTRTRARIDPPAGSRGLDTDLSRDGTLLAYVNDVGVGPTFEERLHLVHTATGADAIAVSKRSLMAPAISSTNDAVVFVEVFEEASTVRDRVWVYRRRDGTSKI